MKMSTLEERLQMKRDPIDKWSIREQLCLASAVVRSGDQNWMSVSRSLKQFAEPNRPSDWFSQKNCAAQYGSLLKSVETPKRKKRLSGSESVMETPGESILRKLTQERKMELKKIMEEEKREYLKLQEEMKLIKSGAASDELVEQMCTEIDEEEKQKEQDAIAHAQWLKAREEKILELERVFRPSSKPSTSTSQKRKQSESSETLTSTTEENSTQETSKPALSPLLTSLLKTPSHVPNVTSSILHTAITSQRGSSPTIASLLNTSASVPVSPSLQQLVSTAISQEPATNTQTPRATTPTTESDATSTPPPPPETVLPPDIKEEPESSENSSEQDNNAASEDNVENIRIKEELVTDEGEESKSANELDNNEAESTIEMNELDVKTEEEEVPIAEDTVQEQIDVYDFDNENSKNSTDEIVLKETLADINVEPNNITEESVEMSENKTADIQDTDEGDEMPNETQPDSVEVEKVVAMDDEDSDKEMNKKVSELKRDIIKDKTKEKDTTTTPIYAEKTTQETKIPAQKQTTSVYDEYDFDDVKKSEIKTEPKETSETSVDIDALEFPRKTTFTPEFTETLFDDMSIQVTKVDKSGKAKRDYSRMKKKEDKDLDILSINLDKVVSSNIEEHDGIVEETGSEKDSRDSDRKSDNDKNKIKDERSNSPWTEEEDLPKTRRRLSATPATPSDSVPNSPASGNVIYDDDRDYRTWKKSVMLVYSRLAAHKYASLFLKPITDELVRGYHNLIYRPMDFQTIRKNIENGTIRTTSEFQREIMLIFQNAIMFNKRNESVYNMAKQMQHEAYQQIQILLQAQAQAETPVRRETRTSESGFKRKRGQEEPNKSKKRKDD